MVLYDTDGRVLGFSDQLLSFIRNRQSDDVQAMLADLDVKYLVDSSAMTLLHHAVKAGDLMTVEYLIGRGCKIDVFDNSGSTPLIHAVNIYAGSILANYLDPNTMPIVLVLLKSKANVLLSGPRQLNALQVALATEYEFWVDICPMIFKSLKRKYKSKNRQIAKILRNNFCTLPQAILMRSPAVTECMLNWCSIHYRDRYSGSTALHYAVRFMDLGNIKLLLERGADIHDQNGSKKTPSYYYKPGVEGAHEVLEILLKHDTSLNGSSIEGYKFAAKVLEKGQLIEVEILLKHDVDFSFDFDDKSWHEYEETLLHSIARNNNHGVMETLKDRKFDVNATNRSGITALWYAAKFANPSSLEFLFKRGADPNIKDGAGYTIFDSGLSIWTSIIFDHITTESGLKCLKLFLKYGADVKSVLHGEHTILDKNMRPKKFVLTRPAVAQVVLMEAMGQYVREDILMKLAGDEIYKKYYNICKRKIEKLQKTSINEAVTLFHFLSENEGKLLRYVRNDKSVGILEKIIRRERHSNMFFMQLLRKRIRSILQIAKLRDEAALIVIKMSGCDNRVVIDRIIALLDKQSLQNLCEV